MFDLFSQHPSFLFLLFLLPLFFIRLPAVADTYNSSYPNCPSYSCGDVNISYPFWKMDSEPTAQFCGYQGFGINCSTILVPEPFPDYWTIPEITLGGYSYVVGWINYKSRNISVIESGTSNLVVWTDQENVTSRNISVTESGLTTCPWAGYHAINLETLPLKLSKRNLNLSFHYNCTECPSFATEILCHDAIHDTKSCFHVMNASNDVTEWDEYACTKEVVQTVSGERSYRWTNYTEVYDYSYFELECFELEWSRMADCDKCEESNGRCGHHNNRGFICFCTDGTVSKDDCKGALPLNGTIILVVGAGSALLSFVIIFLVCYIFKPISSTCVASLKHKTEEDKNIEAFVMQYGSLGIKRYEYCEIKKMTNSFEVKLGEGGFGEVFKGMISDGRLVAVKILSASKSNGQEFINEVASIGRTSHVNIVTLFGFCFNSKKRALVYEYMPNGSLEKFILSHAPRETGEKIEIEKLYQIALGVAHGLDYLHRGCNTRILHLDIKPHNILLDEDFCPKIADFGLAKLYSRKDSVVSMLEARGTLGYIAPEVYNRNFGRVSHKSDVYSYGMLLLEMVGGRKNIDAGVGPGRTSEIYFPDWIYKRLHKHDFLLDSITTIEEDDLARKMTIVGLQCIQPDPNERPSINEVIEMLDGSMEALQFPPKPIFSSPPGSPAATNNTLESIQDT